MEPQEEREPNVPPRFRVVLDERETPMAEATPSANVVILDQHRHRERAIASPPPITNVYRNRDQSNPHLARALDLLEEGRRALVRALQCSSENDAIGADDAVQEFQATLPELFLCGDLGEGYRAIIAGLHFAFKNRQGEPLERRQMEVVERVIRELSTAPFMSVTNAYHELGCLEDNEFTVTPKSLANLFDDEQFA